jgi:chromate transporter
MANKRRLKEVAQVFFKLGMISFGVPAAHISMMEEEVVEKRKWMGRQDFLDLVGATNLIPGPNSTEMTMHCGYERAGIPGLFVAGIAFVIPAVTITVFFAYLYVTYGELPQVEPFIFGIKPAVLAIIAAAILKLGKKALKNWELAVLGILVLLSVFLGVNEIVALLSAGVIGGLFFYLKSKVDGNFKALIPIILLQVPGASVKVIPAMNIFWTFLKVGSVLYGSGYVLFAYLDAELVSNGWMTRQALIDAVAVGQITPGPVLSTATFIGYQLSGFWVLWLQQRVSFYLHSFLFYS